MQQSNGIANGNTKLIAFRHRKSLTDCSESGEELVATPLAVRRRLRKHQQKNGKNTVQLDVVGAPSSVATTDPPLLALLNWMIMPPTVNMAVMGASGCGKTSIVNQFLYCQYTTLYQATTRTTLYQSHVVLEDRM